MPLDIDGKGLIPDVPDERDFSYHDVALGAAPFDWDRGYDAFVDLGIKPMTQDQNGSLSCTGQATKAYTRRWLKKLLNIDEEQSAKFIYGPIHLPGGGAMIRDAISIPATRGSLNEALLPSYEGSQPPSETYMTNYQDDPALLAIAKTFDKFTYRVISGSTNDIEIFAQAIRDNLGVVGGFTGTNGGWTRPDVRIPMAGEKQWGHCVDLCAAGRLDVAVGDLPAGTKCVFTKNSWGDRYAIKQGRWTGYQAIPEAYFLASIQINGETAFGVYVFNSWVLVPDAQLPPSQIVMDFLHRNPNKIVQITEPGLPESGKFTGIIVGDKLRTVEIPSPITEADKLILTVLTRNGFGIGVTKAFYDQIPKQAL